MPRTTPSSPPPLAATLRHLREEAGWTQTRLEVEAGLGPTAVTKLERGIHHLGRLECERLVRILDYPEGWIDRTLAAIDQLPHREPADDSPTALTRFENRAVEGMALYLTRRMGDAVRTNFAPALQANRWRAERKAAVKAWKRLRRASKEERLVLVAGLKDFQTWAVCERLCRESVRAAAHDAEKAREIADLALLAAEQTQGSPSWRNRLLGYVWAFVGNSWKVLGDPREAEKAMSISGGLLSTADSAEPSPLDRAMPLALRASLWVEQERYAEALILIEVALPISGSPDTRVRLLVDKGTAFLRTGSYAPALSSYQEAARWAKNSRDPRLRPVIVFNQALCACALRDFDCAGALIGPLRLANLESGGALDSLRLRWLEARIDAGCGRLGHAAAELNQVWQAFADRRMWLDAAKAVLELAAVELTQGNAKKVKFLASRTAVVFSALALPEELFQSLQLFWDAARREVAEADSARHLLEEIQLRGRQRSARVA